MDLSGVIFVVLALAWAVYLIPKTLKQHDEVARTRSIDRFSGAMRVLAHREPTDEVEDDRDARLVVRPAGASTASTARAAAADPAPVAEPAPAPVSVTVEPATTRERVAARRTAAKVAARRRRRVLTTLLVADLVLGVAGYLAVVPLWSAAVPVVLTVAWLVLCRTQVRSETRRDARVLTRPSAPRPAEDARDAVEEVVLVEEVADGTEDTVGISVAELQEALATRAAEQVVSHLSGDTADAPLEVHVEPQVAPQGTLWDPLPVTLPTYVGKDRARRTVRTIDLGEPGTWTSGRTAEDAQIVAEASEQAATGTRTSGDDQRVVGG